MEGDRIVRVVVEEQKNGEVLSASDAKLRGQQSWHDVEIVRRIKPPVECPSLTQLHRQAGRISAWAVTAHRCERNGSWPHTVHDVTGNGAAYQRLGEHKWQRLLEITQVDGRECLRLFVAVLRAME